MNRLSRIASLPYFEKWFAVGSIIGVAAGVGATVFYYAIRFSEKLFLDYLAGSPPPHPLGEGGSLTYVFSAKHYFVIPLTVALGGLLAGVIVYTFAPEAEGHGTDSAIDAYHNKQGRIRRRIPIIKTAASAITIGSGGSAGREGPTAQIAAGIGSMVADLLGLSPRERRVAVAVGVGAGIGTIFKAPIGGAVLGAEILYRRDFEPEVIFPSLVASAIGYSIFSTIVGFEPIFGYYTLTFNPFRLPFYVLLGVVAGALSIVYVKTFYGVQSVFRGLRLPNHLKPMVGGALTGLIALVFPEVMATGYGWVQLLEAGRLSEIPTFGLPLLLVLLLLPFIKIVATSFTVGSGGSGGVFAPGIFIGASLGAIMGIVFHMLFPQLVPEIAPFVVIGMLSFFGAAGKAPLSVILMVVEMTGSLQLLPAAMLATAIAYIVSGTKYSIYRSQVLTRRDSPAHAGEYSVPLLASIRVSTIKPRNLSVSPNTTVDQAKKLMEQEEVVSLPVVEDDNFIGIVYLYDILKVSQGTVGGYVRRGVSYIRPNSTAEEAWETMTLNKSLWCPVVDKQVFLGVIKLGDLVDAYKAKIADTTHGSTFKTETQTGG
jgi:CIC family chloride channel protein